MKHQIDTRTLTPKITRTDNEKADYVYGEGFRDEETKFIARTYTREQYLSAAGLIRSISENSPVWNIDILDVLGKTPDEIQAIFESKLARSNKRAGYRTLKSRYGEDAAKNIISK